MDFNTLFPGSLTVVASWFMICNSSKRNIFHCMYSLECIMNGFILLILTLGFDRWFRQTKFASFQRQLNIYGFKRITNKGRSAFAWGSCLRQNSSQKLRIAFLWFVLLTDGFLSPPSLTSGPDSKGYYHEMFLRGKQFLAKHIQRAANPTRAYSYQRSHTATPDFYTLPPLMSVNRSLKTNERIEPEQSGHPTMSLSLAFEASQRRQHKSFGTSTMVLPVESSNKNSAPVPFPFPAEGKIQYPTQTLVESILKSAQQSPPVSPHSHMRGKNLSVLSLCATVAQQRNNQQKRQQAAILIDMERQRQEREASASPSRKSLATSLTSLLNLPYTSTPSPVRSATTPLAVVTPHPIPSLQVHAAPLTIRPEQAFSLQHKFGYPEVSRAFL